MAVAQGADDVAAAEALRAELRAWLGAHLTEEVGAAATSTDAVGFETRRAWNALLFDAGWAATRACSRSWRTTRRWPPPAPRDR